MCYMWCTPRISPGSFAFLIYNNDLPNISKKLKFYLFADDTNIYLESCDLQSLEKVMNKELEKLFEWLCINRLSLNIPKTNFIIFCVCHLTSKLPHQSGYKIEVYPIPYVNRTVEKNNSKETYDWVAMK